MTHFEIAGRDGALLELIRQAVQAVNAEEGSLLLLDMEGSKLRFVACDSPVADKLVGTEFALTSGISGYTVLTQQPQNIREVEKDPRFYQDVDRKVGSQTRSMMAVPLSTPEQTFGVMTALNSKTGQGFSREEFRRFQELTVPVCARLTQLNLGMEQVGDSEPEA